jgi:hypothetical protein
VPASADQLKASTAIKLSQNTEVAAAPIPAVALTRDIRPGRMALTSVQAQIVIDELGSLPHDFIAPAQVVWVRFDCDTDVETSPGFATNLETAFQQQCPGSRVLRIERVNPLFVLLLLPDGVMALHQIAAGGHIGDLLIAWVGEPFHLGHVPVALVPVPLLCTTNSSVLTDVSTSSANIGRASVPSTVLSGPSIQQSATAAAASAAAAPPLGTGATANSVFCPPTTSGTSADGLGPVSVTLHPSTLPQAPPVFLVQDPHGRENCAADIDRPKVTDAKRTTVLSLCQLWDDDQVATAPVGTGILLHTNDPRKKNRIVLLTCHHVWHEIHRLAIVFNGQEQRHIFTECKMLVEDNDADFAVVEVNIGALPPDLRSDLRSRGVCVDFRTRPAHVCSQCMLWFGHYPAGGEVRVQHHVRVTRCNLSTERWLEHAGLAAGGSSGGVLLNYEGRLVAIHRGQRGGDKLSVPISSIVSKVWSEHMMSEVFGPSAPISLATCVPRLTARHVDTLYFVLSEQAFDKHYELPGNARTVREWLQLDSDETLGSGLVEESIFVLFNRNARMSLSSAAARALQHTIAFGSPQKTIRVLTTWPLQLLVPPPDEADIFTSNAQLLHLYGLTGASVPSNEKFRGSRSFVEKRQELVKQLATSRLDDRISGFVFCGFHIAEEVVGEFGNFVPAHFVYWMHYAPPPRHSAWERATWIYCDNVSGMWPGVLDQLTARTI